MKEVLCQELDYVIGSTKGVCLKTIDAWALLKSEPLTVFCLLMKAQEKHNPFLSQGNQSFRSVCNDSKPGSTKPTQKTL